MAYADTYLRLGTQQSHTLKTLHSSVILFAKRYGVEAAMVLRSVSFLSITKEAEISRCS